MTGHASGRYPDERAQGRDVDALAEGGHGRHVGERALARYQAELERRDLAPTTRTRYLRTIRAFLLAAGKTPSRVTREDVRAWLAARAARGVRTVRGDFCTLRRFYDFLLAEGLAPRDPTADLPWPARVRRRAQLVLRREVVRALLAEASREPPQSRRRPPFRQALALRNRACLELLYGLGLRAAEVRAARVADLDLAEGSLLCRAAKRGLERRLPLPPATLPHLEAYLRDGRQHLLRPGEGDPGHLLLNQHGRPLTGNGVLRIVQAIAERARVRATTHAFRRSVATHLVRNGVSVPAVQKLLGHASLGVTAHYVHVDLDDLHRAVRVLELADPTGTGR